MDDQSRQYQQLVARCWADEAFKQRLLADPAGTLKAEGVEVPEGMRIQAVENTAESLTLVIPARPTDLSDEMLSDAAVSGGLCLCDIHGDGNGGVAVGIVGSGFNF